MVGVEPVDEALPVDDALKGLYTKLRKTKTFEMDVMQEVHIGKLSTCSNLAHIICTYGCLYQYHLISATCATTNKTILGVLICKNEHISWIDPQIRWDCYMIDTFQIGIRFVIFATNH